MLFGSHGVTHEWFENMTKREQESQIVGSFEFLRGNNLLDAGESQFLCYPYGSYNQDTLEVASSYGVTYGFTIEAASALVDNSYMPHLRLARWDTNDFWDDNKNLPRFPIKRY